MSRPWAGQGQMREGVGRLVLDLKTTIQGGDWRAFRTSAVLARLQRCKWIFNVENCAIAQVLRKPG